MILHICCCTCLLTCPGLNACHLCQLVLDKLKLRGKRRRRRQRR